MKVVIGDRVRLQSNDNDESFSSLPSDFYSDIKYDVVGFVTAIEEDRVEIDGEWKDLSDYQRITRL